MFVNEFNDGCEVDQVLLVRDVERRSKRGGGEYLRVQLGDRTGAVVAMVWEEVGPVSRILRAGVPAHIRGRYERHPRFGPQVSLRGLAPADPGSFAIEDLENGPARPPDRMEADLRELLGTIQSRHLRALLERVFAEDSGLWAAYRVAPAAKFYHQAYRHGLLEHCLSVAQGVSAISATFAGIERDVAVAGALLHDIGKLEAYGGPDGGAGQAIELTDLGRLHGEIALGYYLVRREIEQIDGFPASWPVKCCTSSCPTTAASSTESSGAVHARGDARAHDRQPRWPAGELRPAREGAGPGPGLVGL